MGEELGGGGGVILGTMILDLGYDNIRSGVRGY